ncbi:putative copper transport protein CTR2 [Amylocarpus encephaloides]|uniref:Copper transport protein n=1 Tax=Amylocarpus encephaloides TaxID=45428 RepID=A0A9P7YMH3_9HELO|nr:putative copper transport protein CTR2 [Amylocarpus encephaloides]
MAFNSAFILLLSLASQSLALPVVQERATTYDDGFYRPWTKAAAVQSVTTTLVAAPTAVAFSTETSVTSLSSSTDAASVPTSTGTVSATEVSYKKFSGDGSAAAGWPTQEEWVSFEQMWANNEPVMLTSCASQSFTNNSPEEMSQIKQAIIDQSKATGVDSRFILAVIMSESTGCVRVKSTYSPVDSIFNPGLMQDHSGEGTCFNVPAPCPEAQIKQMIQDGTAGTTAGDGLKQTLEAAVAKGASDATAVYVAARIYNSGNYNGGALEMLFTWNTNNLCLVFKWWHIRTTPGLIFSLVAVVAITAAYEALRSLSRRYERAVTRKVEGTPSELAISITMLAPKLEAFPLYALGLQMAVVVTEVEEGR